MFYDNIYKITTSDRTDKIPEDVNRLFQKAEKFYNEIHELSYNNNFTEIETERRRNNFHAIINNIYNALHEITDNEVLTQLYNELERNKWFYMSSCVLNVFCFNVATVEVWNTIEKGLSDNIDNEKIALQLLSFKMPFYGNGRYLVENYTRHIGTHVNHEETVTERPVYTQLAFDFF